jgi:hypothetical protein
MTEQEYKSNHKVGDKYTMDGKPELWQLSYYPLLEDGKTGEVYNEPKALIEQPSDWNGVKGTDFREVPLRYLSPT